MDIRQIALIGIVISGAFGSAIESATAGGFMLDYGFYLSGDPIKRTAITLELAKKQRNGRAVHTLMTVEDGVRRYMVPLRLADRNSVETSSGISLERFDFGARDPSTTAEPSSIGIVDQTVPFEGRGGRELQVKTERGVKTIVQQVDVLRPDYVGIVSSNLIWDYGLLTSELSDASLLALLDMKTNPARLQEMLSRVNFLVQTKRYRLARQEMSKLRSTFPDVDVRVTTFEEKLFELYGHQAVRKIKDFRKAGQHLSALRFARTVRDSEDVAIETADEADAIVEDYEKLLANREEIVFQLSELEGELSAEDASRIRPLRTLLLAELHDDSISRLNSFLDSVDDDTLKASEKLALAYSAWVGGPANATTSIDDAVDDWELRTLVLDYVRPDNEYIREQRWPAIDVIEGVTIEDLAAMIPLLPAIQPPDEIPVDRRATLETSSGVSYDLQLPPEYSGSRSWPVLIVLHEAGLGPEQELNWWAGRPENPGLAQQEGYIVAAPRYLSDDEGPSGKTHDAVMDVLVDLRKRFRVDSDRVFLGGHGLGADVVWDVGFARPLTWAGIVPIGGRISLAAKKSWENGIHTSIYAVNGGLDGRTFISNAAAVQRLMEAQIDELHSDIILCEYVNRGHEPYGGEARKIFDWFAFHQRRPLPRSLGGKVFHANDTDWAWYHPVAIPALRNVAEGAEPTGQAFQATITLGNTVYVGSQPATLKFSPALVDFSKRVRIRYGSRTVAATLLKPSMRTMLEDFATAYDRERLFWAEMTVP